jgi:hypothetical protein
LSGWIISERERRKMLDVVDLFRQHDTRDELGVGSVHDAFADIAARAGQAEFVVPASSFPRRSGARTRKSVMNV